MQKEPPQVVGAAQPEVREVHPEVEEVGVVGQMKGGFQPLKETSIMGAPPHVGTESPPTSRIPIHAGVVLPIAEVALVGVGVIPGLLLIAQGQGKTQIYQNGLMKMLRKPLSLVEALIPGKSTSIFQPSRLSVLLSSALESYVNHPSEFHCVNCFKGPISI